MNIKQAIQETISRFINTERGIMNAKDINNGLCGDFADYIELELGFGDSIWGDELCPVFWSINVMFIPLWFSHHVDGHCFTRYNNKYYDSECPNGVDYPDQLPFYQRELKFVLDNYS